MTITELQISEGFNPIPGVNPEQRLPSQFSEIIYIMNERAGIRVSGSAGLLSGLQYLCLVCPSGHTFLWYQSYRQIRLVQCVIFRSTFEKSLKAIIYLGCGCKKIGRIILCHPVRALIVANLFPVTNQSIGDKF